MEQDKRASIRIIFKSGAIQDVKCDEFSVTKVNNEIRELSWKGMSPKVLFISLEDISAIFEILE